MCVDLGRNTLDVEMDILPDLGGLLKDPHGSYLFLIGFFSWLLTLLGGHSTRRRRSFGLFELIRRQLSRVLAKIFDLRFTKHDVRIGTRALVDVWFVDDEKD